jgi:hypothetical protein
MAASGVITSYGSADRDSCGEFATALTSDKPSLPWREPKLRLSNLMADAANRVNEAAGDPERMTSAMLQVSHLLGYLEGISLSGQLEADEVDKALSDVTRLFETLSPGARVTERRRRESGRRSGVDRRGADRRQTDRRVLRLLVPIDRRLGERRLGDRRAGDRRGGGERRARVSV